MQKERAETGLVSRPDQLCKLCRPCGCLVWPENCLIWLGTEFQKGVCFQNKISVNMQISVVHCLNYSVYIACLVLFCHLMSIIFCPRGFTALCLQLAEFDVLSAYVQKGDFFCKSSPTPLCFALF